MRGEPTGHFVVLHGYDDANRLVRVADPLADNPGFEVQGYDVPLARLVPANLLVIEPRQAGRQS